MDAKKVVGIVIFAVIIGIGLLFYFTPLKNIFTPKGPVADKIKYSSIPEPVRINGASGYKLKSTSIDGKTVPLIQIPLVTWGGYSALIAANGGIKPSKDSLFYKYGNFGVELIDEENPRKHLQEYANGNYPIIWSTMDMLPLLYDALKQDKRLIPQVFGVFDWSYGGDGIVVRGDITTPKELKGKKVVTSGNTPSHFFLLWLLAQSDLKPSDITIQYVDDAVAAIEAFKADSTLNACVSWSPFIYDVTDPQNKDYINGARILINSKDANQLIADCYLARYDFAKDHPEMIDAFSKAMMEGADLIAANKERVLKDVATLFPLAGGPSGAQGMLGDVHIANFPENLMFFDLDNPISAYKIFYLAQEYYKELGTLTAQTNYEADIIINRKSLDGLKKLNLFAAQQNTIKDSFNKQGNLNIADLESARIVLAEDLQIYFDPQKIDFNYDLSTDEVANNKKLLKKVAEQMKVLGTTIVKLIGHLDTSMVEQFKSQGMQTYMEASAQSKLLSKKRAEYVKTLLVDKYGCDKERIFTEGKGWDMPADAQDQSKNRRVEVKFFSLE
jgi:outer membrane protein OmpA-like peptidoglycan-associated protein